jgi:hypothetical protein
MHVRGNHAPYVHPVPDWLVSSSQDTDEGRIGVTTIATWGLIRFVEFALTSVAPDPVFSPHFVSAPTAAYGAVFPTAATVAPAALPIEVEPLSAHAAAYGLLVTKGRSRVYVSAAVLAEATAWYTGRPRTKDNAAALTDQVRSAYRSHKWPDALRAPAVAATVATAALLGLPAEMAANNLLADNRLVVQAAERAVARVYAPPDWLERAYAMIDDANVAARRAARAWPLFLAASVALFALYRTLRTRIRVMDAAFGLPQCNVVDLTLATAIAVATRSPMSLATVAVAGFLDGNSRVGLMNSDMRYVAGGLVHAMLEEHLKHLLPTRWMRATFGAMFGLVEASVGGGAALQRIGFHTLTAVLPLENAIGFHGAWNSTAYLLHKPMPLPSPVCIDWAADWSSFVRGWTATGVAVYGAFRRAAGYAVAPFRVVLDYCPGVTPSANLKALRP